MARAYSADVPERCARLSGRSYRAALGIDAALAEIKKGKGGLCGPEAFDACIALFHRHGFGFE